MSEPSKAKRDRFEDEANELLNALEEKHGCAQDVVSVLGIAIVMALAGAPSDMRSDVIDDVVGQIRRLAERVGAELDRARELQEYIPESGYDA